MKTKSSIKMVSAYGVLVLAIIALIYTFIKKVPSKDLPSKDFTTAPDSLNIGVLSSGENELFVKLQMKNYELVQAPVNYLFRDSNDYIIRIPGFPQSVTPGDPSLPVLLKQIVLPPDVIQESVKYEIVHKIEKELDGNYSIAPAPPPLFDQEVPLNERIIWEITKWGEPKEIISGRNILIYNQDAYYPAEYCQVIAGNQLRKWRAASVNYSPFRYNPVKSKLAYAEEIIIKITFKTDPGYYRDKTTKNLMRDNSFDDLAQELFINFEQAKDWYQKALKDDVPAVTNDTDDPDYAIITTEDIFNGSSMLDDFCFFKLEMGYSVIVVTEHQTHTAIWTGGEYTFLNADGGFEDVTGDPPGNRPEKIRKWLQTNYLTMGIQYVLLIGNPDPDNPEPEDLVGDIPMQICWPGVVSYYPNDLFYADLTGNWNVDGDEYVGEMWPIFNPALGYSYSNLPVGITGDLFCVRWNGVIEFAGSTAAIAVYLSTVHDGQVKIWVDLLNDGIDDTDLILNDAIEHEPLLVSNRVNISDGTYPIRIEYIQSTEEAYYSTSVFSYDETVTVQFSHDDGTGTIVNGLEVEYFNDNDFSGPPDAERIQSNPYTVYILGGDRGPGGVDFLPEVYLGRIPFYGEDEDGDGNPDYDILDNILNKIMIYENADIHDETWRRFILGSFPYMYSNYTVADYRGGETLMDIIAPPPLWSWFRIHEEPYPDVFPNAEINTGCTINDMVAAWNNPADPNDGRGVVMWRTHGWQTGAQDVFTEAWLDNLDNTKPSVIIQTTCANGTPEESVGAVHHYPLGYTLLKQGAIGTFSASRNSTGGTFDPTDIDISYKNNPYLMYFLAKGIMYNQELGRINAHVFSNDASLGRWWSQILNYDLFGDPTLSLFGRNPRSNNDIIFLLDGSGSMLSEGKWNAAVNASVLFYELMNELRHPAFNDRYNTVIFRWPCTGEEDMTTTVPPLTGLKDLSVPLTGALLAPYGPIGNYCTPVGRGLQLAINALETETEESFYSNKKILLLSDGKHNRGINPLLVDFSDKPEISVEAIGLGEDYIEPETIRDIALSTGGDYRITPNPREIVDYFIQILCNTSWKLQNLPVTDKVVTIDQNYAVFIAAWDNAVDNIEFELNPQGDGLNITPTDLTGYTPMEVTFHPSTADKAYSYYVCRNIPDELMGDWIYENLNNGGTPVNDEDVLLITIEDPGLLADFSIEPGNYYVGSPVILKAKISEGNSPKTELTDVIAKLISSPEYAAGDLMARNSPASDYPLQPQDDKTLRSQYLHGVMENMGIATLNNNSKYDIMLKDDGVGVDNKADDGIYTGAYVNTSKEGSYTFEFFAAGKNSKDVNFKRSETLSEYVKFAAAPGNTEIKIVKSIKNKETNLTTSTIQVIPRDVFGNYMGPFYGDKIKMYTSSGTFEDTYADTYNGIYTFTLTYSSNVKPKIAASVDNIVIANQIPLKVQVLNWKIILLIILIILCFVYIIYKRRNP
ncbi:MAG: VWA domain-containing protein [Bacteroidales bacterium]|nr:VWA domain-containing protein [Bacteroidales bacterium]